MYRWAELVHWVWSEDPGSTTGRQSWSVMYGLRTQGHVQVGRAVCSVWLGDRSQAQVGKACARYTVRSRGHVQVGRTVPLGMVSGPGIKHR